VEVKRGRGFTVAASLHPKLACERIREAAAQTVQHAGDLEPLTLPDTAEIEVDLVTLPMAELCALVPGTQRRSRTVTFRSDSVLEAFRCMRAWMYISMAAGR